MDTHRGRVREWHVDDGWGVVEAPGFDDPVWVHYSMVDPGSRGVGPGGFRQLTVGAEVEFTVERAEQDGFHWRAVWITE
ncbi:cold shock domain-containing protein [Amycolatopsis sp. NBC_00348]|uniref:cold shock domain-containing protein n=1 Tax=unclassified Amycolatopsis TaxID=2618356 RepID=UPI002E0FFB74|nr:MULTISPECIES: cold shock domain-containing protein [unclassified Amycolatopsis]WSJ78073.1 cold shock domain-containing protein [Amycolatopsis sp. NBC_01307]